MSERASKEKVKDVGIDNDCLCIELLNGLRLMGPLRTKPIYRDPVVPAEARSLPAAEFQSAAAS
jgi:hypothetical protein